MDETRKGRDMVTDYEAVKSGEINYDDFEYYDEPEDS